MLFGIQFWINFHVQLAFLSVIFFKFNFIGLSISEFLVITSALFLGDLAVVIYPYRLTVSYSNVALAKLKEKS